MVKSAAIVVAEGFEEIETIAVADILRRAGIRTMLYSLIEEPKAVVKGSRGVSIVTDAPLSTLQCDICDAVILPGGLPGVTNLQASTMVRTMLLQAMKEEKLIASICAASSILASYGILQGKQATSHPSFKEKTALKGVNYQEERVVADGNIITSRSPGTAIEFAYAIVAYLVDKEMVEKINAGVLARI